MRRCIVRIRYPVQHVDSYEYEYERTRTSTVRLFIGHPLAYRMWFVMRAQSRIVFT